MPNYNIYFALYDTDAGTGPHMRNFEQRYIATKTRIPRS